MMTSRRTSSFGREGFVPSSQTSVSHLKKNLTIVEMVGARLEETRNEPDDVKCSESREMFGKTVRKT